MRKLFICLSVSALALVLLSVPAFAQDNIATGLLGRFVSQTNNWWGILRGYALFLFTTTLVIEVCLFGIRMALQQSNIAETTGQFITVLLFAGFIAAVIVNYQEWATGIAVNGLRPLTGELTGNSVDAGQPVALAAAIMEKIMPVMKDAGITDFGEVYLYVSCMLIIMVIFVLISALVILTTCEFYIVANIGVLIIGLGGSKIFKDYAVNVMRYVLSVAVKLFVLQLIVNIGFAIISLTDLDATVGSTVKSIKFVDLFFLIGKAIILLALAKTLPDTCAGMISGSAIGGGNPLASTAKTAGVMAVGAATAGAGYAAGAASAVNNAHTIAKGPEANGSATVGGMARAMWSARGDAKTGQAQKEFDQNPGSIRNQLRSSANAVKAQKLLNRDDSGAEQGSGDSSQTAPPIMAADDYGQVQGRSASQGGSTPPDKPTGGGGSGLPAPKPATVETGNAIGSHSPASDQGLAVSAADGYGSSPVSAAASAGHFNNRGTPVAAADSYDSSPDMASVASNHSEPVSAADGYDFSPSLSAASGISSYTPYQNSYPAGKKGRKPRQRKRKH